MERAAAVSVSDPETILLTRSRAKRSAGLPAHACVTHAISQYVSLRIRGNSISNCVSLNSDQTNKNSWYIFIYHTNHSLQLRPSERCWDLWIINKERDVASIFMLYIIICTIYIYDIFLEKINAHDRTVIENFLISIFTLGEQSYRHIFIDNLIIKYIYISRSGIIGDASFINIPKLSRPVTSNF